MYKQIREFIETRIRQAMTILVGLVIAVWIVSQFIDPLADWLQAENLFVVIIMALVAESLTVLIELKQQSVPESVRVYLEQETACDDLIHFIKKRRAKRIDLIEVSTGSIGQFLSKLRHHDCQIRLLIQNPNCAINRWQEGRIHQRILDLVTVTFAGYKSCEIRLYAVPCSIRGRLIGEEIVSLGWYTYSNDEVGVYGHDNPILTVSTDTPEGRALHEMFRRAFDWLWNHDDTLTMDKFIEEKMPQGITMAQTDRA